MSKSKKVLIKLVVDRSGSISQCLSDMQGALDAFISGRQKETAFNQQISLDQFDTSYDRVYDFTDISRIPEYKIVPRGLTALYDSIAKAIAHTEEQDPKAKKFIVIVTDGLENSSREINSDSLRKIIEKKREEGWEIIYLGANQDAILEAQKMGIPEKSSLEFVTDSAPVAMAAAANYVSESAINGTAFFSATTRAASMKKRDDKQDE